MSTPKSFGEYVNVKRQQQDYSVRQLAKRVDVAASTITRIESGSVPQPDLFLALVDALGLNVITAVKLIEPYRQIYQRITSAQKGARADEHSSIKEKRRTP